MRSSEQWRVPLRTRWKVSETTWRPVALWREIADPDIAKLDPRCVVLQADVSALARKSGKARKLLAEVIEVGVLHALAVDEHLHVASLRQNLDGIQSSAGCA